MTTGSQGLEIQLERISSQSMFFLLIYFSIPRRFVQAHLNNSRNHYATILTAVILEKMVKYGDDDGPSLKLLTGPPP
jgi:hypothetical protein